MAGSLLIIVCTRLEEASDAALLIPRGILQKDRAFIPRQTINVYVACLDYALIYDLETLYRGFTGVLCMIWGN